MAAPPPRYAPRLPLPERPFRPGGGGARPPLAPSEPLAPPVQRFRYAVDLFNAGYWWEAHEWWESLWRETPRGDPASFLLQGLILLAAAQLQGWCGRPRGRTRLLERALARLERAEAGGAGPRPFGLPLAAVRSAFAAYARSAGMPRTRAALLEGMPRLELDDPPD